MKSNPIRQKSKNGKKQPFVLFDSDKNEGQGNQNTSESSSLHEVVQVVGTDSESHHFSDSDESS